ncbi:zonular occludens toxin domain-containing protein [Massilia sp. B-10]|nr:zonular occludens toxin domain-containing protein [Massilia sp. B-10]
MITLQTGLPGHGKTLHCLWFINRYLVSENKRLQDEADKAGAVPFVRQVYYAGIKDLTLPWIEIDPLKWADCPPGSIIVIDECQDVFPGMANGAKRPDFYSLLAKHRHSGFDIFLITQDPSLVDNFVRKLVDRHLHSVRKFGFQRATVYEWSGVQQAPRSVASVKSAVVKNWAYPKEVFGYYKSAEVHTVVRRVPVKLVLAILFVVAMPFVFMYALSVYQSRHSAPAATAVETVGGGARQSGAVGSAQPAVVDPVADAKQYAYSNTPRVDGVVSTSPKYDQLTKPVRVPVPAMCIKKGAKCQCYSQTASKMNMSYGACMDIAYNGYFEDFDRDPNKSMASVQAVGQGVSGVAPGSVSSPSPAGGALPVASVLAFSHPAPAPRPPLPASR